ncbi:MAG: hypothetical protein ACPLSP_01735 [Fervidicoccus fontis]
MILELLLLLVTPIGLYKILRAWKVDKLLSVLISLFFTGFFLITMIYLFTILGIIVILIIFIVVYRILKNRHTDIKNKPRRKEETKAWL